MSSSAGIRSKGNVYGLGAPNESPKEKDFVVKSVSEAILPKPQNTLAHKCSQEPNDKKLGLLKIALSECTGPESQANQGRNSTHLHPVKHPIKPVLRTCFLEEMLTQAFWKNILIELVPWMRNEKANQAWVVCEAEMPSILQGLWGEAISTVKEWERLPALNSAGMGWLRSASKESVTDKFWN